MVKLKVKKERKTRDWDLIFKVGLMVTLVISGTLLGINYVYEITKYSLMLFFSLPVVWSIIGMLLAQKYSSPEQRNMHKVSDFIVQSLVGFFGAFFLMLYWLKSKSILLFIAAIAVLFVFHGYSLRSLRRYLVQRNIPVNWLLVWTITGLLMITAAVAAFIQQFWSTLWALIVLVMGTIFIISKFWRSLTKQFWYAQRYRVFITMGFAFSFVSLVLWTFVFISVGFSVLK
ncbi:hypothetical protein HZC32_01730 [Candidatus Woesearchaeota archaeon]|nr:hypothetical protein [Candidatus Woesearchaeota archaeon]